MLIIRTQQIDELGSSARDEFERGLLSHIEEFFPVHWREVGPEHLREVIREGTTNATSYGLATRRDIYLFVSLMLYLGTHFDTDYQLPWAAAGLTDSSEEDAFTRLEGTYDSALKYLDRVAGPEGRQSAAAVEHFLKVAAEPSRRAASGVPELLAWIHPQKYRELTAAHLDQLLKQGHDCVQTYGLEPQQGLLVCAALAFLLGHGFIRDPQFPWVAETLESPGIADPAQRTRALADACVERLGRWAAGTGRAQ